MSRKWLKSEEFLKFEVKEKIAYITLNRPDKRNALSPELIREIHQAMLEADDLQEVSVIVLQGAGDDFCAGYDLGYGYSPNNQYDATGLYRSRMGSYDDDVWTMTRKMGQNWIIADVHKTVIAKVQGRALAGGAELALICDIIIAADDALIGHPGTRGLGSPPINYWFYHVGPQWAKRLLLTGDSITGKDAARIGLVLDPEIAAAQKRAVNLAMELSGSLTFQKLAIEQDAKSHLSQGPGRKTWRANVKEHGVRKAIKMRDAEYGPDPVRLRFME
jgi:enoyl-CoA hydratase